MKLIEKDGCVKVLDAAITDKNILTRIFRNFRHLGYDFRTTEELLEYINQDIFLQPDQSEVIKMCLYNKNHTFPDAHALDTENELLEKHFGITYMPKLAGYILTNGNMLKMSLDNYMRNIDHREINEVIDIESIDSPTKLMIYFISQGSIRLQSCGFELAVPPNPAQIKTLKNISSYFKKNDEMFVDIANTQGTVVYHMTFDKYENMDNIIEKINKYFEKL